MKQSIDCNAALVHVMCQCAVEPVPASRTYGAPRNRTKYGHATRTTFVADNNHTALIIL